MDKELDPAKVAELEAKIGGKTEEKPFDLDDYDLDPTIPRHFYERGKWVDVPNEGRRLVFTYIRTQSIEAPWSKLANLIEEAENGAEPWRLVSIHSVSKRPSKFNGTHFGVAIMRLQDPLVLPLTPRETVEVEETEIADKAAEWEKK